MPLHRLRSSFRLRRKNSVSEHEGGLFYAVTYRSSNEVRKLINDLGTDVNTTDKQGKTALFYAVQLWYNKSVVDALNDPVNNVDVTDNEETSTLPYADDHNESVVHALIEDGADVNRTDNEGKTALFYAVKKWNTESVVRVLINAGADVNITDNEGKTALFYAVKKWNNESVVRVLIDAGADVNITDNEGKTALFYAVQQSDNESVVRALIDAGANVNITDNEGKTALFYAVQQSNNESVVRACLIAAGANVNRTDNEGKTALFYAFQSDSESVVRELIAAGANANRTDNEGKTALFYALHSYNEGVVRALIDASVDTNITDNERKTALFYAVQNENESVVGTLIAAGTDVNRTDNEGKTALLYAVQNDNESVVRALIDAGADVNITDNEGKTALLYAVQNDNESVVRALIDAGADVNITDNEGKTALFYTVQYHKKSVVRALIDADADVNITDNKGETALFYAVQQRYNEIVVQALINSGAYVNITDNEGKTALFYAVQQSDNESVVRALIDAGADINITDNKEKTALFYAVQQRNDGSVVRALIAACADVCTTDNEGKTALFYAVQQSNNQSVVHALIDAGAGVNITDNKGKTALFYAAQQSNNEIVVRALIDAGTDINITDKEGKTALFFVNDDHENCKVARMLIEYGGAPVDASDHYGRTPLFYALTKPGGSLMKYLLEMVTDLGLHENCNPLTFCIEKCFYNPEKHPNIRDNLNFLIKRKKLKDKTIFDAMVSVIFCKTFYLKHDLADVDGDSLSHVLKVAAKYVPTLKKSKTLWKITTMIKREYHNTRLIESGDLCTKMISRLIKLGANPNTVDSDGNTALHYATQLAFHGVPEDTVMEICRQLKESNVPFNDKNHKNETPLLMCLSRTVEEISQLNNTWPGIKTQLEVCRFLLEHGSNVTAKTKSGESVLHLTIKLLKQGFRKDNDEMRKGVFDVVKELLREFLPAFKKQDISVSIQDSRGNTPLHLWATLQLALGQDYFTTIAQRRAFDGILHEILGLFTEHEAQLNVKNENGETPLHLCSTWKAVELLLDAGANPNDVDSSGQSPLLVAAKKAHKRGYAIFPDELPEPRIFWKIVFKNGLDPWTVDIHGESVLGMLLKSKSRDFATTLIEAACDPERQEPFSPLVMFSLLTSICKDESADAHWKKEMTERILTSTKCPVNGINNEDSPLYYCCKNIIEASKRLSDEEIKTTVHWSMVELLRSYGADGLTRLEEVNRCPGLKKLLLEEPTDPEPRPKLIRNWKPFSKRHERYLAEVARQSLESAENIKPYWYHKVHLACGSFGTVFAGINENDGREVAIKRVENTRLRNSKTVEPEVTNLIALAECEQIVRYLHVMQDKSFSYIILELMEGNLDELLNKAIPINERENLCQDVLKGLTYVHGKGYLHRDLKPTNILYKNDPALRLKIADFGLSRFINANKTTTGTFYGSNAGTRCWVAPEVIKPPKKHSTSSDVFACGLVLHYILSVKRHPFAPKTGALEKDIETNVLEGNTEGWDKSLSPEAAHLIKTMINSDHKKRPSAAEALHHPFFWTKKKKVDLLIAVGNQPEFEYSRSGRFTVLTAVESDLEANFGTVVKYGDWNDPRYVHMPANYTEMMKKRRAPYDTKSVVELVRFIRNAYGHVSEDQRPTLIRKLLLKDFVFLEYFPNLVMEVYKAVTTHGWDHTREEIKYIMK